MVLSTNHRRADRIAFGSCNRQDRQNNFWPIIEARRPVAFIWGGDAIYADYKAPTDWSTFPPTKEHICGTPARLEELYQKQLSNPGYQHLIESNVTIFGAFDDHDYGCDNGDATYAYRRESAVAFVNFLGEPYESAMSRRARAGAGVYGVKLFDFARPAGKTQVHEIEAGIDPDVSYLADETSFHAYSNQSVAVFVLDIRSHKTPWKTGSAAYLPDYEGDFLGEQQWQWLEAALRRSQASVNVILSGVQVHSNKFPDGNIAEAWGKYPKAQQRLFHAILQEGVQSPVLISGDVHMTQLSRKDCVRRDSVDRHISLRPLIEMTTSGMTHSWGTVPSRPLDEPDYQSSLFLRYKAQVGSLLMHALHNLCSWKDVMTFPNSKGKDELQYSLEKNVGELEFDWSDRTIILRTLGEDNVPLVQAKFEMDTLSGHTSTRNTFLSKRDFMKEIKAMHPSVNSDWVCINYRGRENNLANMAGHVATGVVLVTLTPLPCIVPFFCILFVLFYRGPSRYRKQSKVLIQ
ncbi:hypothetical protein FisN_27Hh044 [Fistulifera solaris]|uniref:PhoD-like phosphatase metallophosphatase domain-containing protein n=1 Tax=Fistulifera solaris TaxID=1519565 RepID=A0A1Z5KQL8_FISSO|nr:hypothetical protein FisN_27Hh044 [Fistulifera solaris]|eukprot:GAX28301.1 hypothetical protein FisN_27Hh044 [Fistulifera solaris]